MRVITSIAASLNVVEASSRSRVAMEVASARLRLTLRADGDVERQARRNEIDDPPNAEGTIRNAAFGKFALACRLCGLNRDGRRP